MSNKLETLSILMDEKEKEISPILHNLFSFQELVENKLVPSIEKVQYERKYKLIDKMRDITAEISFYLQAPYLIGRKVYGIYHINDNRVSELINSVLGEEFKQKNAKQFFCSDVPTIIYPEKENDMMSALNIADTSITMSKADYYEIVDLEKNEGMELGSLLRFISVPSSIMDSNTAYIIIPEKINKENKYYQAICDSIDHLVLCDTIFSNELNSFSNLKEITVVGKKPNKEISDYSLSLGLSLHTSNSVKKYCTNSAVNNFEYKYAIENLVYEIGSYLADRKKHLTESISLINKDLVFKSTNTEDILKNIQRENSDAISTIEEIYKEFKNVSDDLITKIDEMQGDVCVNISNTAVYHKDIKTVLIDVLIKMGDTFLQFPYSQARELMRTRIRTYESMGGDPTISSVIFSEAVGEYIGSDDLEKFHHYETASEFVIKKKLDMSEKLKLTFSEYESLTFLIKDSMRPSDKRRLAESYFYAGDCLDKAKELFIEAMELGDEEAGNKLMKLYKLTEAEISRIADFGNAAACYLIAKKQEDLEYKDTLIYLVIAASKGHKQAIKALGDYYYSNYLRSNKYYYRDTAFMVFKAAYDNGSKDKQMIEKMAYISYEQQDYKAAVQYCKESETAYCYYLLGLIYENGKGCSADKKKAYKCYETAAEKGHTHAQVCCERLNAEFQAQAEKNVVKENTNYSSTTSYSGYYSSYYSGW